MTRKLLLFFSFFLLITGQSYAMSDADCVQELAQMDQRIQDNSDRRDLLRAKAFKLEEQADRWQFRSEFFQDARRNFEQAEILKEAADEVDILIERLEQERADFIKKYPKCVPKIGKSP